MTDLISENGLPARGTSVPYYDRTLPLLAAFLFVSAVCAAVAYSSVYERPVEMLLDSPAARRAHNVVTRWIQDGYFHYAGLLAQHPTEVNVYRSSTGFYMVSLLVVERFHYAITGHYSWRLAALHNVLVSVLLAGLVGLLTFRLIRRIGLPRRLAFVCAASVVMLVFTFPDNLSLFWEMTAQAYWAVFATLFLILHERSSDGPRMFTTAQALSAFLMTLMEPLAACAFIASFGATILMLKQEPGRWKRFALLAVLPFFAALFLFRVQLKIAEARFPEAAFTGSGMLFRSGLDGESIYYGNHLDIAFRRDVASNNWPANREYLFRWRWVFLLGTFATLGTVLAYASGLAPRLPAETLTALAGTWVLYAAVFSQAILIHPYLYDPLLYIPLVIALFALAPALAEGLTRRTGAVVLVAVFCAMWYSMFQMRLYALWYPMPGARIAPASAKP